MLLFRKEKKHHDFMEKSKHSEVTHNEKGRISTEATKSREEGIQRKFQENRRNLKRKCNS